MPSLRHYARRFSDRAFGSLFERKLARAKRRGGAYLFYWNRGLGDIALGLVPLFARVRQRDPEARIEVITREELRVPFELAGAEQVHVLPGLERESRIDIAGACARLGLALQGFAAVFDYPDPNRWLEGRRGEFPPRLRWNPAWDDLGDRIMPSLSNGRVAIGAHVNSETARYYGYRKDWPASAWQELFARFPASSGVQWVLLGHEAEPPFAGANLTDLRGKTDFPQLMSVIRNRLRVLVAPDSGVLTMAYYIDAPFALDVVSLWADPRQGVLLQACASPNPLLRHTPLMSPGEDIRNLPVDDVARALRACIQLGSDQ
jgi:ADP-heptose:LPS heptosyltransferase